MTTRVYVVTDRETGVKRLIRAGHQAQAIRHAAQEQFDVAVASQDALIELITGGHAIEDASRSEAGSKPDEPPAEVQPAE